MMTASAATLFSNNTDEFEGSLGQHYEFYHNIAPLHVYYHPQVVAYSPMWAKGGRGGLPADGKATQVDELKALILASQPGTGAIARHIQDAQFTPRHNAFTSLLQLASKSRQPEKAIEIFEAMQTVAGISPNTFSYSALISALARVGQWEQAERYFQELKTRAEKDPDLLPNTVTYAAMISAYEKGRQLDKALAMFEEQLAARVDPDIITYASLLSACERAGAVERAVSLLDTMHEQGMCGPVQMYNSVIAACGSRWRCAMDTFLGMQCAGVEPTSQTATLLMASLCFGAQRDHALFLLGQISDAGWSLSLTAYASLLRLLSSMGDWRAADAVHRQMMEVGMRPDAAAAGSIITAHAIGGDQAGAEQLSAHFIKMGITRVPMSSHTRSIELSLPASDALCGSEGCASLPVSESIDSEAQSLQ